MEKFTRYSTHHLTPQKTITTTKTNKEKSPLATLELVQSNTRVAVDWNKNIYKICESNHFA